MLRGSHRALASDGGLRLQRKAHLVRGVQHDLRWRRLMDAVGAHLLAATVCVRRERGKPLLLLTPIRI